MPTDPTPTPTPREVQAKAMQAELDKHHDWDDAAPGRPVSGCGHHRLADGDFLKMADAGLAALAATGDAPLTGEEVERAAREIVDDLFPDYRHADGGVGRSYQNMVIERLTIALGSVRPILCGTLAAQLAAVRAERDALRERVDAANSVDGVSPDDAPEWVCELPAATAWREGVEHGQDMVLDALDTPARPTDT